MAFYEIQHLTPVRCIELKITKKYLASTALTEVGLSYEQGLKKCVGYRILSRFVYIILTRNYFKENFLFF